MKMTVKSGYTVETMARNIIAVVESATNEQRSDGLRWYSEARGVAVNLETLGNLSMEQAAGILAALSPRVRWKRNIELAFELVENGDCSGVFERSKRQALAILHGARPMDILRGPKTRAFALAIQSDGYGGIAVIDVWALRAATRGKFDSVSNARYVDVATAYAVAARRLGYTVHECQAIAWVVQRGAK